MRGPGIDNRFMVPTRVKIEMEAPHELEGRATPLPSPPLDRGGEGEEGKAPVRGFNARIGFYSFHPLSFCSANPHVCFAAGLNSHKCQTKRPRDEPIGAMSNE